MRRELLLYFSRAACSCKHEVLQGERTSGDPVQPVTFHRFTRDSLEQAEVEIRVPQNIMGFFPFFTGHEWSYQAGKCEIAEGKGIDDDVLVLAPDSYRSFVLEG